MNKWILWPPDANNWLTGKDPDAGRDWGQEEKEMTEDEMVGWHHQLNEHEFEQDPGVGDGQGSSACRSPWGPKESDITEWLNSTTLATRWESEKIIKSDPKVLACRKGGWKGGWWVAAIITIREDPRPAPLVASKINVSCNILHGSYLNRSII